MCLLPPSTSSPRQSFWTRTCGGSRESTRTRFPNSCTPQLICILCLPAVPFCAVNDKTTCTCLRSPTPQSRRRPRMWTTRTPQQLKQRTQLGRWLQRSRSERLRPPLVSPVAVTMLNLPLSLAPHAKCGLSITSIIYIQELTRVWVLSKELSLETNPSAALADLLS